MLHFPPAGNSPAPLLGSRARLAGGGRFGHLARWIAAVLLLAGLGACSATHTGMAPVAVTPGTVSGGVHTSAAFPQALPVDRAQPWEHLDSEGRVLPERTVSSINSNSEFIPGVERYLDSGAGGVSDYGEASAMTSGSAGAKALSYAIYRIPLGADQPGVVAADVNLHPRVGDSGLSGYFLGLSDYSHSRWEWHGPYSDYHVRLSTGAAVRAGTGYTSPLGDVFVCVAAYDGSSFDVVDIGLNRYDGADVTAPPAPGGLTATPVAGGLQLQWNGVLAADLAGYRIYWRQAAFTDPHSPGVVAVDYLDGATLHFLPLPATGLHSVAVAAVDFSGNESAISAVVYATPLPGAPPLLVVSIDAPSAKRGDPVTITATGAVSYSFDLDSDGVIDTSNPTGIASVDTTSVGIIRPFVMGEGADSSLTAMGGVSLIVLGNTRPVASATASPQSGVAPLSVTFTGTAEDIEDPPAGLSYAWDFDGDGTYEASTDTLTPPAHIYSTPGTYNCKFRATDTQGAWAVDTVGVDVHSGGVNSTIAVSDDIYSSMGSTMVGGLMGIVFQKQSDLNIYYIRAQRPDATTWSAPVLVEVVGTDAFPLSMVVVNGNPAVAWCRFLSGSLNYVRASTPQGTAWNTPVEVLPNSGDGYECELVVANGHPAIGYHMTGEDRPYYIRSLDANGDTWAVPTAVDSAPRGKGCSTAVVDGLPAMVYGDTSMSKVYYTRAMDANGATWGSPLTLDINIIGNASDLQVIGGVPCAAFADDLYGNVWYLYARDTDGAYWQRATLVSHFTGLVARQLSLAEFNGHPALAFTNALMSTLDYCEANDAFGVYWQTPLALGPSLPGDTIATTTQLMNLGGVAAVGSQNIVGGSLEQQLRVFRLYR